MEIYCPLSFSSRASSEPLIYNFNMNLTDQQPLSPIKDGVETSNEFIWDLKEIHDVDREPRVGGGEEPDPALRSVHLVLELLLGEELLHRLPAPLHPHHVVALPVQPGQVPAGPAQRQEDPEGGATSSGAVPVLHQAGVGRGEVPGSVVSLPAHQHHSQWSVGQLSLHLPVIILPLLYSILGHCESDCSVKSVYWGLLKLFTMYSFTYQLWQEYTSGLFGWSHKTLSISWKISFMIFIDCVQIWRCEVRPEPPLPHRVTWIVFQSSRSGLLTAPVINCTDCHHWTPAVFNS